MVDQTKTDCLKVTLVLNLGFRKLFLVHKKHEYCLGL